MSSHGVNSRDELAQYNHLRARILENAPILHGASPRVVHHGYALVTSREPPFGGESRFSTALIAYTGPYDSVSGTLLRKSEMRPDLVEALRELLGDMERDIDQSVKQSEPGEPIGHLNKSSDGDLASVPLRKKQPIKTSSSVQPGYQGVTSKRPPPSRASSTQEPVPQLTRALGPNSSKHRIPSAVEDYLMRQGFQGTVRPSESQPYRRPVESPSPESY